MARHASNRDRIQRMAAEAEATEREKAEHKKATRKTAPKKKVAKKKAVRKKRVAAKAVPRRKKALKGRVKIVWVVCDPTGSPLTIYPYREKDVAESEVRRLSEKTGHTHMLRSDRLPMEKGE